MLLFSTVVLITIFLVGEMTFKERGDTIRIKSCQEKFLLAASLHNKTVSNEEKPQTSCCTFFLKLEKLKGRMDMMNEKGLCTSLMLRPENQTIQCIISKLLKVLKLYFLLITVLLVPTKITDSLLLDNE